MDGNDRRACGARAPPCDVMWSICRFLSVRDWSHMIAVSKIWRHTIFTMSSLKAHVAVSARHERNFFQKRAFRSPLSFKHVAAIICTGDITCDELTSMSECMPRLVRLEAGLFFDTELASRCMFPCALREIELRLFCDDPRVQRILDQLGACCQSTLQTVRLKLRLNAKSPHPHIQNLHFNAWMPCARLTSFSFQWHSFYETMTEYFPKGLVALLRHCAPRLTYLDLFGGQIDGLDVLEAALNENLALHTLNLSQSYVDGPFMSQLARIFPHLTSLAPAELCTKNLDFLSAFRNCVTFDCRSSGVWLIPVDALVTGLARAPQLTRLCIRHEQLTSDHLACIVRSLPLLTTLALDHCYDMDLLDWVHACAHTLQDFSISYSGTRMTLSEMLKLRHMSRLTSLSINNSFSETLDTCTRALFSPPSLLLPSLRKSIL